MAITFTPEDTVLSDVYKPNATTFNFSATSDHVDADSVTYALISHDFPSSSVVTTDASGVHVTGDSSDEFTNGNDIEYMEGGLILKTTLDPLDIVFGDDLTSWIGDPTVSRAAGITVRADARDVGDAIVESSTVAYTITFFNDWDAHKAGVNTIMSRLYP